MLGTIPRSAAVQGTTSFETTTGMSVGDEQSDRLALANHPDDPAGSVLDTEVENRVQAFLRGVELVVRHHKAPEEVVVSLRKQVCDYLRVPQEGEFLKRAKYLLLQPMAVLLRNDPPAAPAPFSWRGKFRKWMKSRLVYSRKNAHLWFSFLQAKRAAAPVSESIVLATFEKHRTQMATTLPIQDSTDADKVLEEYMVLLEPLLNRVSEKLYRKLSVFWRKPTSLEHVASSRASVESSRLHGGQLGALYRETFGTDADFEDPRRELQSSSLRSMSLHVGRAVSGDKVVVDPTTEIRGNLDDLDSLQEMLAKRWPSYAIADRLEARCAAVLEPFKVRTITKGPAIPYYLAKPLQKAIHGILRKYPTFRLIGRPLQVTDLMDVVEASTWKDEERVQNFNIMLDDPTVEPDRLFDRNPDGTNVEEFWASVDYSSATDELWARLSAAILSRCLRKLEPLNPLFTQLMLKVLAPHRVTYPIVDGVKVPAVNQANGQLMGSVLSFPVLCIANAGLILRVKAQRYGHDLVRKRFWRFMRSMLINGDDALYRSSRFEWDAHIALGQQIGLKMSPGKAYLHSRYANVNSTSIDFDVSDGRATPYLMKFLNSGLYFGQHKVLGEIDPEEESVYYGDAPHISVISEVWKGAYGTRGKDILAQYLHLHSDSIRKEQRGRNLFLPVSSGGWGQECPDDFKNVITRGQIAIGAGILKRMPYLAVAEFPMLPGKALPEVSGKIIDPFLIPSISEPARARKGPMSLVSDLKFGFIPYQFARPAPQVPEDVDLSELGPSDLLSGPSDPGATPSLPAPSGSALP